MYDYIREIKRMGFTGVVNYPTAGMIDGRFRAALEAEGAGYERVGTRPGYYQHPAEDAVIMTLFLKEGRT